MAEKKVLKRPIKDKIEEMKKNRPPRSKAVSLKTEDRKDLKKLYLYFTIVPKGQANAIVNIMQDHGSSLQFGHIGKGTATREVLDVLGIQDNAKEVIMSIVTEDKIEDIKREIDAYFTVNPKRRGIAFTTPFTSVIGAKVYHFLTNTI